MKFGAHMSTSGGAYRALQRGRSVRCEVVQLFVECWTSKRLKQHFKRESLRAASHVAILVKAGKGMGLSGSFRRGFCVSDIAG
jgi:hypothetical protein